MNPSAGGTAGGARLLLARLVSIVGHPALLMPLVFLMAVRGRGAPASMIASGLAGAVVLGLVIMIFSYVQVRAGRWSHVDASVPNERRQLNFVLCALFAAMAVLMWAIGQPVAIAIGFACSAGLVVFAQLLRGWLKVSLHVAFAVFGALLLWPSMLQVTALLLVAVAVCWSRLALARHTLQEVGAGVLGGCLAGLGLNLIAR